MKKVLLFFAALAFAFSAMATETTVDFTEETVTATANGFTLTVSPFSFEAVKNNGSTLPSQNGTALDLRMYAKATFSVTMTGGNMSQMVFAVSTQGKKRLTDITASTGTVSIDVTNWEVTWTGDASTVVFTVGDNATYGTDGSSKAGQFDVNSVVITSAASVEPAVATPTFDVAAGTYTEAQLVLISNYNADYIYAYTTDGTAPAFDDELNATNGTVYDSEEGIEINSSCTLKVLAIDIDGNTSAIASAAYVIKILNGITLTGQTTEFTVGDAFKFGGTVNTTYTDESIAGVNVTSSAEFSGYDMTVAGEQTVTVSYTPEGSTTPFTATYVITVADLTPITTMDAIFAAATEAESTATNVKVTFNNWVVSGVKGNNAYVTDGTKGFIIYTQDHGFEMGDVLSGTVLCKVQLYKGSSELTGITKDATGLTVTKGGSVTPAEIAISSLTGAHTGVVLSYTELTYNGTAFSDGTNTITPYNTFVTLPTMTSGVKYNVTGVFIMYNTTKEIAPLATSGITEWVAPKYAITVTPATNGTISANLEEATAGAVITLTTTPATGYKLASITVKDADNADVAVSEGKFTMPAKAVTVSATFVAKAQYTITWSVNGETTDDVLYEDEAIVAPSVSDIAGKSFVNWVTTSTVAADAEPTWAVIPTLPMESITYYAVFADGSSEPDVTAFSDDFEDITSGNNTTTTGQGAVLESRTNYTNVTLTYPAGGMVKLGSGKAIGSMTLAAITAAVGQKVVVSCDVKGWSTVEGSIVFTVGADSQSKTYSAIMNSESLETVSAEFTLTAANPTITIATSAKRAFIDNIVVVVKGTTEYSNYTTTVEADPEYDYYMVGSAELFGAEGMKMDANGTDAYRLTLNNVELAGGDYTYNVEARPVVEQSNAPRHIAAAAQADKSFTLAAGTYSLQFDYNAETGELTSTNLTNGFPTSLDNTEAQKVEKIFRNGQVVIIKNGVEYNAIGQKL